MGEGLWPLSAAAKGARVGTGAGARLAGAWLLLIDTSLTATCDKMFVQVRGMGVVA